MNMTPRMDSMWQRWYRALVLIAATLVLSACRTTHQPASPPPQQVVDAAMAPPSGPSQGCPAPAACPPGAPFMAAGGSFCGPGQWRPDGIACPWPADEYLCDGGDQ